MYAVSRFLPRYLYLHLIATATRIPASKIHKDLVVYLLHDLVSVDTMISWINVYR